MHPQVPRQRRCLRETHPNCFFYIPGQRGTLGILSITELFGVRGIASLESQLSPPTLKIAENSGVKNSRQEEIEAPQIKFKKIFGSEQEINPPETVCLGSKVLTSQAVQ